jgi:hypothetical protein
MSFSDGNLMCGDEAVAINSFEFGLGMIIDCESNANAQVNVRNGISGTNSRKIA